MEDNMKRTPQGRMVSMLGIWAIFVITAIVITACTHPGTDSVPSSNSSSQDTSMKSSGDVKSVKDASTLKTAPMPNSDRDSSHDDTRRRSRYDDPFQVPTYEKTSDGFLWYNNEKFNYSLKFPEWMNKEIGSDGNIILTGSASDTSSNGKTDSFTINTRFIEQPDNVDSMAWFDKFENQGDEKVAYNGYDFKLEAVADTEGPYTRRAYVPMAESGVLELTFTYSTTSGTLNESFEKKAKEGYYGVITSATELFLSM